MTCFFVLPLVSVDLPVVYVLLVSEEFSSERSKIIYYRWVRDQHKCNSNIQPRNNRLIFPHKKLINTVLIAYPLL